MDTVHEVDLSQLDINGEAFQQDPYPWYAAMRRSSPVCQVPGFGWYFVATMDLVREVLADPRTYSSRVGKRTAPPPEVSDEAARLRQGRPPALATLLGNDPPEHTAYRRMANKAFTPRSLAWMEGPVRAAATELASALPDEADFLEHFAIPLPVYAICRILGLGEEHRGSVRRWTDAMTATIGSAPGARQWLAAERDRADFDHVMLRECDRRRRQPREDLLTQLVRAVDHEVPTELREAVVLGLVRQLLVAGNETTTRLLAEAMALLGPDDWIRLRRDPGYGQAVTEEALRLGSPVQQMVRRTTVDAVLGGVQLASGSRLLVSFASANRDASVFPDPDRFDPDRANRHRQVAFGHGIHACLGAGLARMESRIALRTLAERTVSVEVLPHEPLYLPSFLLRGRTALPVRVTR
jgi:cytochrome P450